MEELITVDELARRLSYARQTIYNKIHKGEFALGHHYIKISRRKILFRWAAIQEWLAQRSLDGVRLKPEPTDEAGQSAKKGTPSRKVVPLQGRIRI